MLVLLKWLWCYLKGLFPIHSRQSLTQKQESSDCSIGKVGNDRLKVCKFCPDCLGDILDLRKIIFSFNFSFNSEPSPASFNCSVVPSFLPKWWESKPNSFQPASFRGWKQDWDDVIGTGQKTDVQAVVRGKSGKDPRGKKLHPDQFN